MGGQRRRVGVDAHIGPPARDLQICHSEKRQRRRISCVLRTCFLDVGCALRGTVFLIVQKDGEERARQGEGLFTKPPFSLDPHPPKFVCPPRLTDAVRDASLCSARAIAVRREMSGESLHRELACEYAETTPPVILSAAKNLAANLL